MSLPLEIPLFPESGLHTSIFPPVLIGLGLATFFAETLGWTFSGLVLAGYLSPILIVKPWSFAAIVFEAFLTYVLSVAWDLAARRLQIGTPLFGRDRFYAILLISVMVRLACEAYAFDAIEGSLQRTVGARLDYRGNLYGIGLITVPLLANLFWKSGIVRGLLPVGITIGATTAITQYLLVPFTNYSLSRWEVAYEDVALDFLKSPRAYLIMMIGAGLAHRATLDYGFDYGGILIPGLLALAWFTPLKVVCTLGEAVILAAGSRLLLSLPAARKVTVEGPRRLLFIFSLGFAWKYVLGQVALWSSFTFSPAALYGFGYILPAIVANRILQKGQLGLIVRPLLQTSLAAAGLGVALGVALETIAPAPLPLERTPPVERYQPLRDVAAQLVADAARMERSSEEAELPPFERSRVAGGLAFLLHRGAVADFATDAAVKERGVPSLASAGYEAHVMADLHRGRHVFYVRPVHEEQLSGGVLVLDPEARGDSVVVAPFIPGGSILAPYARYEESRSRALLLYRARPGRPEPGFASAVKDYLARYSLIEVRQDRAPVLSGEAIAALDRSDPAGALAVLDVGSLAELQAPPSRSPVPPMRGRKLQERLRVFHDGVMAPLVSLIPGAADPDAALSWARRVASGIGYRVDLRRLPTGSCVVTITPLAPEDDLGTIVLRLAGTGASALVVPDSARDPSALAWSLQLFEALDARALLLGPSRAASCPEDGNSPESPIRTFHHEAGEALLFSDRISICITVRSRAARWPALLVTGSDDLALRDETFDAMVYHLRRRLLPLEVRGPLRGSSPSSPLAKLAQDLAGAGADLWLPSGLPPETGAAP